MILIERIKARRKRSMCVIGYMVAATVPGNPRYVSIGMAICNIEDKFNKEEGKRLAMARVANYNTEMVFVDREVQHGIVDYLSEQLDYFSARACRYFRNQNLIIPKIKIV